MNAFPHRLRVPASPELPALPADTGFVAEKAVLLSPELPALPADAGFVQGKAAEGRV
jgi:hypothetical protein